MGVWECAQKWVSEDLGEDPKKAALLWMWLYRDNYWAQNVDEMEGQGGWVYMYVCMYVDMYVCMHVCMYVCMYLCMYVFMHVCMYVCMYV